MKKLHILIVVFLISLAICAFASYLVKADTLTVSVSPGLWNMDVGQSKMFMLQLLAVPVTTQVIIGILEDLLNLAKLR